MIDRYLSILEGKEKPRFHETGRRPAGLSAAELKKTGLKELWQVHNKALDSLKAGGAASKKSEEEVSLLHLKAEIAHRILSSCQFCERRCGADRASGELGYCGVPAISHYASEFFHYGEEPELVPSHTIFFCGCTFSCVYCQNWDIATRPLSGVVADPARLAVAIDNGRRLGSRNVNFVGGNPDSHLHTCLEIVSRLQTDVPVVWNSNSYASQKSMNLLDGVVDVYLSDFRYGNDACAQRYSDVPRYWRVVTRNLLEADRQAEVMLRHLVLPGHLECCTAPIMQWVSEHIPDVYFNLMFQYHPEHRASLYPELDRLLTRWEIEKAKSLGRGYGIALRG